MTDTKLSEEEYYELLVEAREQVRPTTKGVHYIFGDMVKRGTSKYSWELSFANWFLGPWLTHHRLMRELRDD